MPARLLGIDLRSRSSQAGDSPSPLKRISAFSVSEIRPASMEHIKRPDFLKKHASNERDKSKRADSHDRTRSKDKHAKDASRPSSSLAVSKPKPFTLAMAVESPPALFLDSAQTSSGHLLSGRLQITPISQEVTITSIAMYLEATVATKRPVADKCRECLSQVNDLYEWTFLSHPVTLKIADGMHELPFSHLIPGHLPATTHGHIGSVDYALHVRAKASDGNEIEYRRDLDIKRALRPGSEKHSIRVFPPTNLTLNVTLPSIVYPIGSFNVHCRLDGITTKKDDIQTRWRLRKLAWRIEEQETMVSPACAKHAAKVGGEGKGIKVEDSRNIGVNEIRGPFKTDLSDGVVESEFECVIDTAVNPQCDMESANGLKISHALIVELVIAEEWAPNRKPHQATPTGAARVLRTTFNLVVTQRQGMGISWDDEMPPMYEDVPASPPQYANQETHVMDYHGDDLHEDVEHLRI